MMLTPRNMILAVIGNLKIAQRAAAFTKAGGIAGIFAIGKMSGCFTNRILRHSLGTRVAIDYNESIVEQ